MSRSTATGRPTAPFSTRSTSSLMRAVASSQEAVSLAFSLPVLSSTTRKLEMSLAEERLTTESPAAHSSVSMRPSAARYFRVSRARASEEGNWICASEASRNRRYSSSMMAYRRKAAITSKWTFPQSVSKGIARAAATTARILSGLERSLSRDDTAAVFCRHSSSSDGSFAADDGASCPVPFSRSRMAAMSASTRILSACVNRIWPVEMSTNLQFTSTAASSGV